ncbi:MAG: ABC transporter ATP-binding protein/permease [Streptococcaceae bacterium]|jgi:ATP-binding cassette subfamily C protein|nr:ABC transporter ATP-binding protein/permease [Streptococcaceae bacterium]
MKAALNQGIKGFNKYLISQFILSILLMITSIIAPFLEGLIINEIIYSKNMNHFYKLCFFIFVVVTLKIFLSYFTSRMSFYTIYKFGLSVNKKIIHLLFKKDTLSIKEYDGTYLHSRISDDVHVLLTFILKTLPAIFSNLLLSVIVCIFLFIQNKKVLFIIVFFILIYLFLYFVTSGRIFNNSLLVKESLNSFFSFRNNLYLRYMQIKSRMTLPQEFARLEKSSDEMLKRVKSSFHLNYVLSSLKISISFVFKIIFFIFGGISVMKGELTIGMFTIIMQYFMMLMNNVDSFFEQAIEFQEYKASNARMNEIFSISDEEEGKETGTNFSFVRIENFNIFPKRELEDSLFKSPLTVKLKKGNLYSLVGKNGSGKSTFILTLIGVLKENFTGNIFYGESNFSQIDLNDFRKNSLSIMLQNDEELLVSVGQFLQDVLPLNKCEEILTRDSFRNVFANELFDIRAILDKDMSKISGGQRQLVQIFATLCKQQAQIIILDEPFSNVASLLKIPLLKLLIEMAELGKIVVIVAHEEEIIVKTNKILLNG